MDDADHAPGSAAWLSCDHVAAREGRGGETGPPRSAAGHAEAGASMAHTAVAGTKNRRGGGYHLNQTFLLWEKANISKWD